MFFADYWTGYTMKGGAILGSDQMVADVVIGGNSDELSDFPSNVNFMSSRKGGDSLCVYLQVSGQMNYLIGCSDQQYRMLCYKSL